MNARGRNHGPWPRWMTAATAAAYTDERSVRSFLRSVGSIYPRPYRVEGKGKRWLIEELDAAIDRLTKRAFAVQDAAEVL